MLLSKWKYLVNYRTLHTWGGLKREGELISNFDEEGRGLLERGFNREGGLIEVLRYKNIPMMIVFQLCPLDIEIDQKDQV